MPVALTADCFARLRLRWGAGPGAPESGELPGAIDRSFEQGRMVDQYLVTPAASLWTIPGLPPQNEVNAILFCQQADGAPWQVLLHSPGGGAPAEAEMEDAEFRRLLAANGLLLPGEPGFVPPQKSD